MIRRIWRRIRCRVLGHVPVQQRSRLFLGSIVFTAHCERCGKKVGAVDGMRWFVLSQDFAHKDKLLRRHQADDA